MVFKFLCLLVVGLSTFSGAEAQACVAGGDACLDASFNTLGACCEGAVCMPTPGASGFGGFCMMYDSSCIAGGYPCSTSSDPCCSGTCIEVFSGTGFCVSM